MKVKNKMPEVRESVLRKRRRMFGHSRRRHDPMLVLNMSIFNFENGWDRPFNPPEAREIGTR